MSKSAQIKTALVTVLIATALIGRYSSSRIPQPELLLDGGLLLFGVINVLLPTPGTLWVRAMAIVATIAALLWPGDLLTLVVLLVWLVWPPAFMVAWALALRFGQAATIERQAGQQAGTRARIALAALIGAVAVWLGGANSNQSIFDRLRHGWDEKRRAWDQHRRAWEQERRAEEQARRQADQAAQATAPKPASAPITNQ